MSKDFESKIKTQQEAKKIQEASKKSVPISKGLIGRMAVGFESEIKKHKKQKRYNKILLNLL